MKLSIIVPVYNMAAEHKLEYCLDSLVNQTLEDYEIIAVDDCSTDESWAILQQYEKRFSEKFHAVHSEENKHQGGAKNIGLKLAKGEWIGFIDSDDWIRADMYERLIGKAEETGADLVGCDYCLTDEHSMKVGQDNALGNSYLLLAKHFEYIAEPLYYYYQHDASTVHTISEKRCEDRCAAGRLMLAEAERHDFLDKYRAELEYSFTLLFYVNTLFTYMAGVKRTKYRFVKALGEEMRVRFPDFQQNPYYLARTHEEEKKLIRMQMKSTLWFMAYYKLLWAYRNWRKAHGNR